MDKRKGIILAVVLFLLIGLGTFVFADEPNEDPGNNTGETDSPSDTTNNQNGSTTNPDDESEVQDDNSGTDDEGTTVNRRPASTNSEPIQVVIGGGTNSSPSTPSTDNPSSDNGSNAGEGEENPGEVTEEPDTTAPVITINGESYQGENNNIGYVNGDIILSLAEDNLEVVVTKDGEELSFKDDMTLSSDGKYVITVTDEAGNVTSVEFGIDKSAPVLLVNGNVAENGTTIYVNEDAKITVEEENLKSFITNGHDRTENILNGSWTASKESSYSIIVTDIVGNTTAYTIVVDKTPIVVNHLYVLNNTHNKINVSNDVKYKVIGNGQDLYVEYVLKERFDSTPVITVGEKEFEMTCNTASWDDSLYKCDTHITITDDMNLENGEVIPFTITGVKDKAGNETIVTEENVEVNEKYGQVIYDNEAPVYNQIGILNVDHLRNGEDVTVANIGDEIRVLFHINEELATSPKMTIGESDEVYELVLNKDYDNFSKYTYVADIRITEDMNLADESLAYTIYGYADAAGNVGSTIRSTDEDLKVYDNYPGVNIDTTVPKITVTDPNKYQMEVNTPYVEKGYSVTDNYDGDITDQVVITYQFQAKGTGTWNFVDELNTSKLGTYKVIYTATDSSGNTSKDTRVVEIVDTTKPEVILNGKPEVIIELGGTYTEEGVTITDNSSEKLDAVLKIYYSENGGAGTWKESSDNKVDTSVLGQYKIWYTVIDSSGNTTQVTRIVKVVDTTMPTVEFPNTHGNDNYYNYEYIPIIVTEANELSEVYYTWNNTNNYVNATNKVDENLITDNGDGTYTVKIPTVNGKNRLHIKAIDVAGNTYTGYSKQGKYNIDKVPAEVTVTYEPETFTNNIITVTLTGNEKITIEDTSWTRASDTVYTKEFNENKIEEVTVKDRAGNVKIVEVAVTTIDKDAPVVKINGSSNINVEFGSEYTELGATMTDNVDTTITNLQPTKITLYTLEGSFLGDVTKTGVDTKVDGKYLLYYDYTDEAGNSSLVDGNYSLDQKRWVIVTDTTAPVIKGVESNKTYIGSFNFKITELNDYTITFGTGSSCDSILGTTYQPNDIDYANLGNGITWTTPLENISICVKDAAGNSAFVGNISLKDNTSQNVVSVMQQGGEVVLSEDVEIESSVRVVAGKKLTIDLNGNDISFASKQNFEVSGGTLNIIGEGTIKESAPYFAPVFVKRSLMQGSDLTVNIGEDVTLEGWSGIFIDDNDAHKSMNTIINFAGTINSVLDTGGAAGHGIYVNGEIKDTINYPIVNIMEGSSIKSLGDGLYAAGYAEWNIYGGTIEAPGMAIGIKAGKLNIYGGTLRAYGPNDMPTENFGNGIFDSGAALQIESNQGYAGNIEINISGGTLISENAVAVYEYDSTNTATEVTDFNITGGAFISNNYEENLSFSPNFNAAHQRFITGGKFNRNDNNELQQYVAEGYRVQKQDDNYVVVIG